MNAQTEVETIEIHNREKKKLERNYLKKRSNKIYTALEDLDFHWDFKQVKEFKELWMNGISILQLEERFNRSQEEIAVLILDCALKGEISQRKGGLFGWNVQE